MGRDVLNRILDLARWAPSGDNTQPWRFEVLSDDRIAIHGHDTREWCVYDFEGHASHMAHGALLETIRIAATGFGLQADWSLRPDCSDAKPVFDVRLSPRAYGGPDELLPFITLRTVQRRPMSTQRLSEEQEQALHSAIGESCEIQFFSSLPERWSVARLLWDNAHIRLTCPEAYRVHKEIIEWGARFSKDRIPEQAVGVDPVTAKLMRWVMHDWRRVVFFNRYLMGTIAPRLQLDVVPAIKCATHALLKPRRPLASTKDFVQAGMAMQRLWLTATRLGLHLQPEMTPVIFRWYARAERRFSAVDHINEKAIQLSSRFEQLAGSDKSQPFAFFCRLGVSAPPRSRSTRHDLESLMF